jgi:hypothetical protein
MPTRRAPTHLARLRVFAILGSLVLARRARIGTKVSLVITVLPEACQRARTRLARSRVGQCWIHWFWRCLFELKRVRCARVALMPLLCNVYGYRRVVFLPVQFGFRRKRYFVC